MLGFGKHDTEKSVERSIIAATDAVQIFDVYGFMRDYPVEKLMRDAKVMQVIFGSNHHLMNIISTYL